MSYKILCVLPTPALHVETLDQIDSFAVSPDNKYTKIGVKPKIKK